MVQRHTRLCHGGCTEVSVGNKRGSAPEEDRNRPGSRAHATSVAPSTESSRDSSNGRSGLSTSTTRLTSVAFSGAGKGIERDLAEGTKEW